MRRLILSLRLCVRKEKRRAHRIQPSTRSRVRFSLKSGMVLIADVVQTCRLTLAAFVNRVARPNGDIQSCGVLVFRRPP